jgi:lipopolysaccharide transport system permease protein
MPLGSPRTIPSRPFCDAEVMPEVFTSGTSDCISTRSLDSFSTDGVAVMESLLSAGITQRPNEGARVLILEKGRAERNYWSDLWHYRELFAILAWRDVAVRYKQTVIGVAWAVMRPFLTLFIFSVVFGTLAKFPSDGAAPYPVLVFAAMLPWFLFSSTLTDASNSLVSNASLISKVYFPRIIVPASSAVVALVDLGVNLGILFAIMVWYRLVPNWQIAFLPVFILLAVLASLGPALFITSLNVRYRDFRFIIPFVVQFGLYVSPVGFSSAVIPHEWRLLYSLNPVVGVIDGFRWCLLGGESQLYLPGFLLSLGVVAIFLWLGIRYFRRTERTFADLI